VSVVKESICGIARLRVVVGGVSWDRSTSPFGNTPEGAKDTEITQHENTSPGLQVGNDIRDTVRWRRKRKQTPTCTVGNTTLAGKTGETALALTFALTPTSVLHGSGTVWGGMPMWNTHNTLLKQGGVYKHWKALAMWPTHAQAVRKIQAMESTSQQHVSHGHVVVVAVVAVTVHASLTSFGLQPWRQKRAWQREYMLGHKHWCLAIHTDYSQDLVYSLRYFLVYTEIS
jgi:hypothetical protein